MGDDPVVKTALGRRGFIGWMGKVGLVAVSGVAGAMAVNKAAEADVKPRVGWNCCGLAHDPGGCPTDPFGYPQCPQGYFLRSWTCCSGTAPWQRMYGCGECTPAGDCHNGPFYCSGGWTVRANGC